MPHSDIAAPQAEPAPDEARRPKVMLAGDWHGNHTWARVSCEAAARSGCFALVQLGDFGLWPGREDTWLDHVDGCAREAGLEVVWIDGNHENHDALDDWRSHADERGLVRMRDHVTWATRGSRWEWEGVRFGALGGAVSLDRFMRREGKSWWPQESISSADLERLGNASLDVLVTHTPPTPAEPPTQRFPFPEAVLADDRLARSKVDEAVRWTEPTLVVHGHLHVRYTSLREGWRVEGLAHDKSTVAESLAVLELSPELKVSPPLAEPEARLGDSVPASSYTVAQDVEE